MYRAPRPKFRRLSVRYGASVVDRRSPETRRTEFTAAKRPGQAASRCVSRRNLAVRSRSGMYLARTGKVRRLSARFASTMVDNRHLRRGWTESGLAIGLAQRDHSWCASRQTFVVRSRSSMYRAPRPKFRRLSVRYGASVVDRRSPETRRTEFTAAKRPGQAASRCSSRRNLAVRSRSGMYQATTAIVCRV